MDGVSLLAYNSVNNRGKDVIHMINDNLISLRKLHGLTQEDVADRIGVSRQTLSKWETGESVPDLQRGRALAELFGVTLDDLTEYDRSEGKLQVPPKGKYTFGSVKVGENGQIVIPAKARKVFDIKPGDHLIILGDVEQGLAILPERAFLDFVNSSYQLQREN